MFVFLLSDKMDPFYQNLGSFPTLIFSFILGACLIYWLFAVLGVVDINLLDLDLDLSGPDLPEGVGGTGGGWSVMNVIAGYFVRFGLFGVPMIIILSFIGLFGWMISFTIVHLFFDPIFDTFWRYPAGLVVVLVSAYCATWITAYVIRPLRKVFEQSMATDNKKLIGKRVVVRTSRVDDTFGQAYLEDGSAGLILQVRSADEQTLSEGEHAVILEYEAAHNHYRILSEARFEAQENGAEKD